ncbi:SDR family oxidoreductase [Alphaproteobacteria bacterium]|nr:SDR family oxidoreductase [Alphaproteobacteria bacterium]MDA9190094.1 SDR family oxidoreductase [Alphaproteobacteria bacterium]MDC0395092.1 SDR family oxidoreductase [Alphaproteobacteria bacterium]MDC0462181.1 SDR family oxidoreductase [Alphaproteobacteria bacterium]MDC3311373.1 SDR family oxidoreductase [Alphaproteobacteria bacterium]
MSTSLPRTPSFNLAGKRALVAGASSGIGVGCAVALCEAGASVTLVARSADSLHDLQSQMREQGWDATACVLDVTDISATRDMINKQDPFDILVNSAGMARHGASLDTSIEDFDAVSQLNIKAGYFLNQAVAKRLIETGKSGSLMTISSQMAVVGGIDRAVYCATKHAAEGYTKSQAIEWGPHQIRVNTICPTFVRTALSQSTFANPERKKWIESKIKLGRVAEIEDIMGAVVFLASDASAMITGTSLLIDGGWTAD